MDCEAREINSLRIGTRNSRLARIQTELAIEYISKFYTDIKFEIIPIVTSGDVILDRPLYEIGGKALFTKELENALLNNEVDLAVHSAKDIEADYPKNLLSFPCVLPEEDNRDVFIGKNYESEKSNIFSLKENSIIGSSSVRRQAQVKKLLGDRVKFISIRGNINTRLEKLKKEENLNGIILALAGLKRINLLTENMQILDKEIMLPAVAQGIIAIQSRSSDIKLNNLLKKISDFNANIKFRTSRSFVETINGSCTLPLAMDIKIINQEIEAKFMLISNNRDFCHSIKLKCNVYEAEDVGMEAGKEMLKYIDLI